MVKGAGPIKPSKVQSQPLSNLQQKEGQQVKQQKAQNLTSSDRARLASQAGFQKTNRKGAKKGGLEIGDSSKAPIPLPDDDVDPDAWSQEALDGAQGSFALAGSQFGEIAEAGEAGASLGAAVVGSSYLPTEEDIAEMDDIAKRGHEPVPMMDEVSVNSAKLFGIKFPEETPVGHKVLAVGLVVAGEQESVKVGDGALDEAKLAGGIEKVTKKGNQAVGEAQKMNKGINKELSVHRTFVFKR